MSDTNYIGDNFECSPGHILISPVESSNKFKIQKKSEGLTSEAKVGKVLKVGDHFINDFGIERHKPCKVGDTVLYVSEVNQNYLEVDFKQLPVIRFGHVLGVIK